MRIPIITWIMVFVLLAILAYGGIFVAIAEGAQPREDSVSLDKDGCTVELQWTDGLETTSKITFSVDGVVKNTFTLDDIVGDQSAVLLSYTGQEGESLRARLYIDSRMTDEDTVVITKCPTATATATATSTATMAPTATSTPAPTATPVVIIVQAPAPVAVVSTAVPVATSTVRPPSTGDGGLVNDGPCLLE